MGSRRRINVAITMSIGTDPTQSIWYNGANQHCVYLCQLLWQSPVVQNVWLTHNDGISNYPAGLMLGEFRDALRPLSQVIGETDLLIEMNSFIGPDHAGVVRRRSGKCVTYKFGNDYVITVEGISFGQRDWVPNPSRTQYDEVWTNPQHEHTCRGYFEALYHAPVWVLPHIWSPYFIDRALAQNPALKAKWGYSNQGPAKRLALFEPNINVVKNVLIPMLAANEFYLRQPDLVKHVFMTNTVQLKENAPFKHIALGLKMVQDGKATADHRFPFIEFAAEHTDVVVSHQWENGLNYLFYDALQGGYPLVHNSPFLRDVGYYYRDFDVADAATAIGTAVQRHDQQITAYGASARAFLDGLSPSHADNVSAYTGRIAALFDLDGFQPGG